ncbi:CoA transferase [Rhodococcus sp. WS4]|nr:CoA transferase [Rhodococcus sp. WS4]
MNTCAPNRPLDGVRVVHLASLGPGPYGAMLLADMGADVVVVDRVPALTGSMPPEADPRRRGQRSIAVDLRNERGRAIVTDLVASADVLIEGMRPGVAERLGVGPQDCRALNNRLIYARMTGWGQEGRLAKTAGHDINYVAATGALYAMGDPAEPPPVPLNLLGDYAGGGVFLVLGVLAALWERERTGVGTVVDTAIVDGVASLTAATLGMAAAGLWHGRGQNTFDGSRPWYRTYQTRDGGYMAVGAIEPQFYAAMLRTLGLDPSQWQRNDDLDTAALTAELTAIFKTRDRDDWTAVFAEIDACVSPVLSFDEATTSPTARERHAYVDIAGVVQPAPLPRLDNHPMTVPTPPPTTGRDSAAILTELGRNDDEIRLLEKEDCIMIGASR